MDRRGRRQPARRFQGRRGARVIMTSDTPWRHMIGVTLYDVQSMGGTMAVYYIGTYDIVDPEQFKKYPPVVMALLPKYGGVVLASDTQAFVVEGTSRTMNAIIRFPSKEAALGLYNDPEYQEAKRIRQASTKNVSMVLAEEIQAGS